jgi:hypothetical protein
MRGAYTGSLHAPATALTLRPRFEWTGVESGCGTTRFELQVEDSCAPGDLEACKFDSPELDVDVADAAYAPDADLVVSSKAPVGALYAWRVRACDASRLCSAWSSVGYLNVGRTVDDLNGDGYADVVVEDATAAGTVLDILLGAAQFDAVFDARSSALLNSPRFAGDLNGDGFADLVGVVPANLTCGSAQTGYNLRVVFGASTPETSKVEDLCRTVGTSSVVVYPSAVGDLNGDGFDDLGVVRSFGSQNDFEVYTGATELAPAPVVDVVGGSADYAFTRTTPMFAGAGDFDEDSYADVIVGEAQTAASPLLHLLRGGGELTNEFAESLEHTSCVSLISVTLAGDVDDDGDDDFTVLCSWASDNRLDLLPGGSALATRAGLETAQPLAMASRALDFDADGKVEWFITSSNSAGPIIWDPSAPEDATNRFTAVGASHLVQSSDNDGDGRVDLTFFNEGGSPIWLGSAKSFNVSPLFIQPPEDVTSTTAIVY